MQPLVLLSGQIATTCFLATVRGWGFTQKSRKAEIELSGFRLEGMPRLWKGAIYYAADPNPKSARQVLEVLSQFPCWPDPSKLLRMVDRNSVALTCFRAGLYRDDPCEVLTWDAYATHHGRRTKFDLVIKVGNEHSGNGKFLVPAESNLPVWEGKATVQPFFRGRSVRILHIDSAVYFIETVHRSSWIKNSPGGENVKLDPKLVPNKMLEHSFKVRDLFGLDVCGNDYVLEDNGSFHFLEANQFPGLDEDLLGDVPRNFFLERMRSLESIVSRNEDVLCPAMPSPR